MRQTIRLNETDLHRIVKQVLNEAFKSNILRDLNKKTPSEYYFHGGKDLRHKMNMDFDAAGMPVGRDGLDSSAFLDKITDDMIEIVTSEKDLQKNGFYVDRNNKLRDTNNQKRQAIRLRNGKIVIFKNDDKTLNTLKQFSKEAGEKYIQRERNKYNDGKNTYQWSDEQRGRAYRDWRDTGVNFWDKNNMFQPNGKYQGWRKDSWVRQNMDKVLNKKRETI